jgi:type III secretory pathway lipoprotein EscJ
MKDNQYQFLINVKDEFDANRVIELMRSNDINAVKQYSKNSQVTAIYMGISMFGIDIFVEHNQFNKAKSILTNYYEDLQPE